MQPREQRGQRLRPVQRVGVLEGRRRALLDQVADDAHAGVRDADDDVVVGVPTAGVMQEDPASAEVQLRLAGEGPVGQGELHVADRFRVLLAAGLPEPPGGDLRAGARCRGPRIDRGRPGVSSRSPDVRPEAATKVADPGTCGRSARG